jgi:hypothetical protein
MPDTVIWDGRWFGAGRWIAGIVTGGSSDAAFEDFPDPRQY